MSNNEEYNKIKIPKDLDGAIKTAHDTYKEVIRNIGTIIPKINIPDMKGIEVNLPPSLDIIYEQNAWERHKETMEIENAILNVQNYILEEQKSTSKLTFWILVLTIIIIMLSLASLVIMFIK